jgi:hypothetical protein
VEDSRDKLDFKKILAPDFALTYDTIVACSAKKFTLFSAIMSNTLLLPYEYRHVREDYPVTAVKNMDRKRAQCIQTRSAIIPSDTFTLKGFYFQSSDRRHTFKQAAKKVYATNVKVF